MNLVETLRERLDCQSNACVSTLHAFGLQLLRRAFGSELEVVSDKLYRVTRDVLGRSGPLGTTEWRGIQRSVDRLRHAGITFDFSREPRPLPLPLEILRCMQLEDTCIDQEEQIYRCLEMGFVPTERYDLVLVDEGQDMNAGNVNFLKQCVLSPGSVLCVVGDPHQAIYSFRGALTNCFTEIQKHFTEKRVIQLTGCFRCPRRIIGLAAHLNPVIRGGCDLNGDVGRISLHRGIPSAAWIRRTVDDLGSIVILSRTNATILKLLGELHRCGDHKVDSGSGIHWMSASVAGHVERIMTDEENLSLRSLQKKCEHDATSDPTVRRIIQAAVASDGGGMTAKESSFMQFVNTCLNLNPSLPSSETDAQLTLSTVHAFKGRESQNIVLLDYNRFGRGEDDNIQDHNLLYIAVTRSTDVLMLPARSFIVHQKEKKKN